MRRAVCAAVAAAAGFAAVLALTGPVEAASCRAMVVGYSLGNASLVVLSPSHVDIGYRGCVQFTNQTAATATITVTGGYSQQLAPDESTSGSRNYVGTTSGRQQVTATSGAAPASSAHGTITVGPRAAPEPSAAGSRQPSPRARTSPTASMTPTPTPSPAGPRVAPTPRSSGSAGAVLGVISPPVSPAGPIQLPSRTPAPVAAGSGGGPVEPASGRGLGLPAAIAALAIVGVGTALVRVVAREAVDNGDLVGGTP